MLARMLITRSSMKASATMSQLRAARERGGAGKGGGSPQRVHGGRPGGGGGGQGQDIPGGGRGVGESKNGRQARYEKHPPMAQHLQFSWATTAASMWNVKRSS